MAVMFMVRVLQEMDSVHGLCHMALVTELAPDIRVLAPAALTSK